MGNGVFVVRFCSRVTDVSEVKNFDFTRVFLACALRDETNNITVVYAAIIYT
jgi:hypothetical protein